MLAMRQLSVAEEGSPIESLLRRTCLCLCVGDDACTHPLTYTHGCCAAARNHIGVSSVSGDSVEGDASARSAARPGHGASNSDIARDITHDNNNNNNDEEDEDEDEEPRLKYQRLGASVLEILAGDVATALAVHDKFLVRWQITAMPCCVVL